MSFVEKIERERNLVYYIRSTPVGKENCWFFLKLNPFKRDSFNRVMSGINDFDLADYGEILHSGYGDQAPQELKQTMSEKYGVKYDD